MVAKNDPPDPSAREAGAPLRALAEIRDRAWSEADHMATRADWLAEDWDEQKRAAKRLGDIPVLRLGSSPDGQGYPGEWGDRIVAVQRRLWHMHRARLLEIAAWAGSEIAILRAAMTMARAAERGEPEEEIRRRTERHWRQLRAGRDSTPLRQRFSEIRGEIETIARDGAALAADPARPQAPPSRIAPPTTARRAEPGLLET